MLRTALGPAIAGFADELNGAAILNVDHLHGQCM
jgi:hypothetical protein